jgi:hypothetical protein
MSGWRELSVKGVCGECQSFQNSSGDNSILLDHIYIKISHPFFKLEHVVLLFWKYEEIIILFHNILCTLKLNLHNIYIDQNITSELQHIEFFFQIVVFWSGFSHHSPYKFNTYAFWFREHVRLLLLNPLPDFIPARRLGTIHICSSFVAQSVWTWGMYSCLLQLYKFNTIL